MSEQIENRMVMDSQWDDPEYRVPTSRLQRERRAYEEAEMEDESKWKIKK